MHTISGEPVLEGKYHIESRLGQGGMGVVYCAKHAYLKTRHAIKVILPDLVGNDPQLVQRFQQEALAAAAIRHQNVVGVSDYGVISGTMPFLVMEYVEGESLHDLLEREKRLSPKKALELITAIGNGLAAAHKQGIVHRDIKPLNVMIVKNTPNLSEAVKILDFGLAKIKSGELLGSFIQAQTTGLMGSPYYMAPEQWSDEDPDARSDIYSLGVMLFQMMAGDVPFKGSSIPAIMKKHLSDAPPAFSDFGVEIPQQVEIAVRHALEKEPENRTPTVKHFIEELRSAVGVSSSSVGAITSSNLPVSNLQVLTNPAQSAVFVDDVPMGKSQTDGWLSLEGLQSGRHHVRVQHDGFQDWVGDVVCDGKPQQVVARLLEVGAIPKPPVATNPELNRTVSQQSSSAHNSQRQMSDYEMEHQPTISQNLHTSQHQQSIAAIPAEPQMQQWYMSPLVWSITGILGLFLLLTIGFGGAYFAGMFGDKPTAESVNGQPPANSSPTNQIKPPPPKSEMVKIAGGDFTMGRNDGKDREKPAHPVTVKDFWMDKTEVTNAEYYDFVTAIGHTVPQHWVNGKPLAGNEKTPVRYVSYTDAKAFAEWRSKRDGREYRLPTEQEWEYAARNGSKENLYPWGDEWTDGITVIAREDGEPLDVGSRTAGKNDAGVFDLIGNVWEWTDTKANVYPGSKGEIKAAQKDDIMIRGGSAKEKPSDGITSTFRFNVAPDTKDKTLGFRLVSSNP